MATAFLTSLWGMACSITLNLAEKSLFNRTTSILSRFCHVLDAHYKLTKTDRLRFDNEDREAFFRRLFVPHIEGKDVMPAAVLSGLLNNSAQQTAAFELFSRVLADRIRISTDTVELRGRIKATIEETLRSGISQDELDSFLEEVILTAEEYAQPQADISNHLRIIENQCSI